MSNLELSTKPLATQSFSEFRSLHKALVPRWEAGEAVPSLHRPVAELQVDPETLKWVEQDVLAMGAQIIEQAAMLREGSLLAVQLEQEAMVSRRLQDFLYASGKLFEKVIVEDSGVDSKLLAFDVYVGPYEGNPDNYLWHRDYEEPGGVTYVLPLLGDTTTYTLGSTSEADFTRTFLNEDLEPQPATVTQYGPRVIIAHDSTLTPHHGPRPTYNGQPRILINAFVDGVL